MNLDYDPDQLRVPHKGKFSLTDQPTLIDKLYSTKKQVSGLMEEYTQELSGIQQKLYADDRYSVLLIFQGMDAAGKDGLIRHVFSGVNPQGCQVFSFKQPSSEELDHDFLWRVHKRMPERGRIGIFNRSYYEDVLVVKVDPKVFAGQKIPQAFMEDPKFWKDRYKDINRFEDYMTRQGTHIIKFFLHLSKEEQRQRFLSRIDEPDKNWKLSPYDVEVRARWDDYQEVYEDCLKKTSTKKAPWYCIPADDKQNARILVSHIIVESLRKLPVDYPQVDDAHRQRLKESREQLESEA